MSARLDKLLARERDGELTALEREELNRLSRLNPVVRRERAAWAEVEQILRAPVVHPEFRPHRLARRIADQVQMRPHLLRSGSRWVLAFAACCAVAVVTSDRSSPPNPKEAVTQVAGQVERSRSLPVEVRFHGRGEADPDPVEITF